MESSSFFYYLQYLLRIKQPTFFSGGNFINIALNVAPRFIIACGVSGCLITKGTDLSAGRMVGLICLLSRYLTSEAGLQRQVLPEPSGFRKCLGLMGSRGSSDLCGNLLYLWFHQWYRNFLLTGSGLHRNTWYAADRLRCLPCLHKRNSDRWLSQCVHSSSKRKTLWCDPVSCS